MQKRLEEYPDFINRLFPQHYDGDIHNKKLARTVTFQVTDNCNLCCTYCYEINKGKHVMSFETAKKFIDDLLGEKYSEYIGVGNSPAIIIEFIGGEPFLAIDVIAKITDYFIEQMILRHHPWATRYLISICTNGVLYFNPKVQEYIKKHLAHLSFSISIDGNKQLHDTCRVFPDGSGSYDLAVAAMRHFTGVLKGHLGSKMTLAPQNVQYTFSAVKNLIDLGYKQIFLNCVYEKGWTIEHAQILYQQLRVLSDYLIQTGLYNEIYISMFDFRTGYPDDESNTDNWCGGTGYMIAVDYKGDIFPCLRYMESSLGSDQEPMIIGNVNTGLMSTEKQKSFVHCLNCISRRTCSTDKCFYCPIAHGCGYCSALNYQEFGTADKRTDYHCDMHAARTLANVYYFNQILLQCESCDIYKNHVPEEWALKIVNEEELKLLKHLCER